VFPLSSILLPKTKKPANTISILYADLHISIYITNLGVGGGGGGGLVPLRGGGFIGKEKNN
jgi:hypothetical protein